MLFRVEDKVNFRYNFVIKEFVNSSTLASCIDEKGNNFFIPSCCPYFYLDTDFVDPLCPLHTPFDEVDEVTRKVHLTSSTKIYADLSSLEEGRTYVAYVVMDYQKFKHTGEYKLVINQTIIDAKAPRISNKASYVAGIHSYLRNRPLNGSVFKGVIKALYVNSIAVSSVDTSITHVPCFALVYFYSACPVFANVKVLDHVS